MIAREEPKLAPPTGAPAAGLQAASSRDAAAVPNVIERLGPRLASDALADTLARCVRERTAIGRPTTALLQRIGSLPAETARLVPPTEHPGQPQIERAYATFLARGRTGVDLGLGAAYAPNMYSVFRAQMLANGGQYWNDATAAFEPLSVPFALHYGIAPADGSVFSTQFNSGLQANVGVGALTKAADWQYNKESAVGRELALFLGPTVVNVTRQWSNETRVAISQIHNDPGAAQQIVLLGGAQLVARLRALLDVLVGCAHPQQLLQLLDTIRGDAVAMPAGFTNALNHIGELAPAAARVRELRAGTLTNLSFGDAAGGLPGHFKKHVLGIRAASTDPAHVAAAAVEAETWMTRLNLAPGGAITRASLPNLVAGSPPELAIFTTPGTPTDRPADQAQTQALIAYLSTPAGDADAALLTAAHKAAYEGQIAAAFDAARPAGQRYLYYEGALKVAAHDGTLFMVAAWAPGAGTFRISTGFIPPGGSQASYDSDLPLRMLSNV